MDIKWIFPRNLRLTVGIYELILTYKKFFFLLSSPKIAFRFLNNNKFIQTCLRKKARFKGPGQKPPDTAEQQ